MSISIGRSSARGRRGTAPPRASRWAHPDDLPADEGEAGAAATIESEDGGDDEAVGAPRRAAGGRGAVDMEDDADGAVEVETPGARLARESAARGHPSLSSLGGAQAATTLTQSAAQLVLLDMPSGLPFGIDRASFVVGERFKGMKMVPPGVHYVWYSAVVTGAAGGGGGMLSDPDMAPRVGFFVCLQSGDVLVRRWEAENEMLSGPLEEDEAVRYAAGARRFDFDAGQGTYPLHQADAWRKLVSFVRPQTVARLEPIGKNIGATAAANGAQRRKYKLEDKFASAEQAQAALAKAAEAQKAQQQAPALEQPGAASNASGIAAATAEGDEGKASDEADASMSDIPSGDAAAASTAAAASASAAAVSSVATPADSAASPTDSKLPAALAAPTTYYSRIPRASELVSKARLADPAARAALLSQLHLDHTPRLDALLQSVADSAASFYATTATASSADDAVDDIAAAAGAQLELSERELLGELQFSFVAFLIGQDQAAFEAWKELCILLCSCVSGLESRHALFEAWAALVLPAQLAELPRDFFVDPISGDNFLAPALQRLFDAVEERDLASGDSEARLPTSLRYALREVATLIAIRFDAPLPNAQADPRRAAQQQHVPLQRLPAFRAEDPDTVALRQAAAAESHAQLDGMEEKQPPQQQARQAQQLSEAQQRQALRRRLQAQAEEDEYAPTLVEE